MRLGVAVSALVLWWAFTCPAAQGAGEDLLQPEDLVYEGAFLLEAKSGADHATWAYTNGPLAYYPEGDSGGPADGHPGSLFMAGHVYRSWVAELSIPAPVISRDPSKLNTARFLQGFSDVLAPVERRAGFIMGMTYLTPDGALTKGRIYFTCSTDYMDLEKPLPGIGWFDVDLSKPRTAGLWYLGDASPFNTTRYIAEIPKEWAEANAPGMRLALGRHRNSVGNAEGPNVFAAAPWLDGDPPAPGSRLRSQKTLMAFGGPGHPSRWGKEFAGSDNYQGLAWLTSGSKSAVVITGIKEYDVSKAYYGYENWVRPDQCEPSGTCKGGRGWRCADGRVSILFFNPSDFVDVVKGSKEPHKPEWYARLDINHLMFNPIHPTFITTSAPGESFSATFDRARGILYVSEGFAYAEGMPVVHVFRIAVKAKVPGGTKPPPSSPK